MRHNHVNQYYNVYRLVTDKKENLCVAVSKKFETEIEKLIAEYGSITKVPIHKTIQGIFLECSRDDNYNFDAEKQESDITVNQLRPYKAD